MKSQITNASPETRLQSLLKGNERFLLLKSISPQEDLRKLKDAAEVQHPFAVSLLIN